MPQIMNMSGFLICQGSKYNEKGLVLEQATLIFEMEQHRPRDEDENGTFFLIW